MDADQYFIFGNDYIGRKDVSAILTWWSLHAINNTLSKKAFKKLSKPRIIFLFKRFFFINITSSLFGSDEVFFLVFSHIHNHVMT